MHLANHLSCFALICLISILSISCEKERHIKSCFNLKPFSSFRSDLKFKFTRSSTDGRGEPHVEEYRIKETFHQNKGKLNVESLNKNGRKILIFDYDKKQVFIQDLVTDSCQSSRIQENNQKVLGKFVFWDKIKANVAGPTAIFNGLANSTLIPKKAFEVVRGLNTARCYFQTTVKKGIFNKKVIKEHELFILKDFLSEAEPLLRLTYSDHQTMRQTLSYELDYFQLEALDDEEELNFESDDELTNSDFWFVPDYCVEKSDGEGSHRQKTVRLPVKYELTLHKLEGERSRTFGLIADEEERLIGLSGSLSAEKVVLDLRNGVQYEFGLSSCHKHFNGHYRDLEQYADLLEIMHKLKRIAASDYIGLRSCREMNCDAYSFYSSADRLEDILRDESNGDRKDREVREDRKNRGNRKEKNKKQRTARNDSNGKANKAGQDNDQDDGQDSTTLYTFYLRANDSTAFQHLVQVKKQLFAEGTNNEPKRLMETTVYDVYDFKSLESDDPRSRPIDLTQCAYEDEHRIEIRMTALAKQAPKFKDDLRVENDTLSKVKQITKLTDHNIPRIEKLVNENSLTVSLTLIQPINDLAYFETFDRYAVPLANLGEHFESNLEMCATMGKKNADWVGIQHCADSVCYPILSAGQFELGEVNNTDYEKQCCTMKRRDAENSERMHYVELPDAIGLIERSIENGEFKLSNAELIFQRLENEQEFNQIDKADLFKLVRAGSCFDAETLGEALKCKLKRKITDCILTCQSSNCNVFSVRKLGADQFDCCFTEPTFEELQKQHGANGFLQVNSSCNVYELSYLNQFNRWSGKTVEARPERSMIKSSPEDCAIECLKENVQCRSFSFCHSDGDYHCELRSYNPHGNGPAKLIDSNHCSLYSANFLVDYHRTDFQRLTNFSVTTDLGLQDCARQCKQNGEECSRFEFCQDKGNIACLLETGQRGDTEHPTDMVCTSYLKNKHLILDDLVQPSEPAETEKGDAPANHSLYVYAVFFFILGLATGSLALFSRRVGVCGPKKRFCGKYYIQFVQEEDAISIRERIEARKFSEEKVNHQSQSSRSDEESPAEPATTRLASIQQTEQPAESETQRTAISRSSSKTDDPHQAFGNES